MTQKVNKKKVPKKPSQKDKTKPKKKPKKKVVKKGDQIPFYKKEKTHRIIGMFLVLMTLYLFIAFTSYLFSWKTDYDVIDGLRNSFWSIFGNSEIVIENITGKLGALLSYIFITKWFGIASYLLLIMGFGLGLKLVLQKKISWLARFTLHGGLALIWFSITLAFLFPAQPGFALGGYLGIFISQWFISLVGSIGTGIVIFFLLMTYLGIFYNFPFSWISKIVKRREERKEEREKQELEENKKSTEEKEDIYNTAEFSVDEDEEENDDTFIPVNKKLDSDINSDPVLLNEEDTIPLEIENQELTKKTNATIQQDSIKLVIEESPNSEISEEIETLSEKKEVVKNPNAPKEHYGIDTPYDPHLDLPDYILPSTDLLETHGHVGSPIAVKRDELEANKKRIVETLNNYNIKIDRIGATIGPTVTLYEIVPAPGIRISKIKNLEDDIALSLSALGIRIIAPIPGRGTIGIEVPNSSPEIVSMKSVLESDRFKNTKFELPIAIGKTISNQTYVADLAKMPHLLMAGATGQGKSVGLNAIIASLLYSKHPSELKFVMVDPKKVELSLFSKIERHYLAKLPDSEEAIITDTKKVVKTLNSLVIEMDNRYELLKDAQVRNIKEYNPKFIARKLNPLQGHNFMPYIVLVVDEFADLMMTAGKDVEGPITRLAQLARAVGIHLVIATQRPSVNVITGTIKANFPARIAFRVTSRIDSRTILDASGADQLIGRGDMLLSTGNDLIRLQCAFVDTPEIDVVTDFIGSQRAYPEAFILPEVEEDESGNASKEFDSSERDPLFEDAATIIVQTQQGSTSLLQRKLKLGYNRAGRIIDQLEAAGIVGAFEGSKAREVKVGSEMALEQFLKDLNS